MGNNINIDKNPQPSSSNALATFVPSAVATCSKQLLDMANVYSLLSRLYGDMMIDQYETQRQSTVDAANAAYNAGHDDAMSSLMDAFGSLVSGAATIGAGSLGFGKSNTGELEGQLDNAKSYKAALDNGTTLTSGVMSDNDWNGLSTAEQRAQFMQERGITNDEYNERLSRLKTTRNFTEGAIDQRDADVLNLADKQDPDIIELRTKVNEKIESLDEQIMKKASNPPRQKWADIVRGAGETSRAGFTFGKQGWLEDKATQQKDQTLANFISEMARTATNSEMSQFEKVSSAQTAIYNQTLVSIAQAGVVT